MSLTRAEAQAAVADVRSTFHTLANLDDFVAQVLKLWREDAWKVLGHRSWEAMCKAEFGERQLPALMRKKVVRALDQAMSTRAIAAVVGVSHETVRKDCPTVKKVDSRPTTITGLNGKRYRRVQTTRRTPSRMKKADVERATTVTDLAEGLTRVAVSVGILQQMVDELGVDVIKAAAEYPQIHHDMRIIHHVVVNTLTPFVSTRDINQARKEWERGNTGTG